MVAFKALTIKFFDEHERGLSFYKLQGKGD